MKRRIILAIVVVLAAAAGAAWYLRNHSIAVLQPRGQIAAGERDLIVLASSLSLIVVVPVFIMLFSFAWRYREDAHPKTKYQPEWDHHSGLEATWWLIPTAMIVVLSVVAWKSAHSLDPFRPIASATKTVDIEVVALQWKWLFIYPEQDVATINTVYMPVGTPVNFHITSDAPMNSFWVPSLGGQMYAMAGMSTQLHLEADEAGSYRGSSANISGDHFADMTFTARAISREGYTEKMRELKATGGSLDISTYNRLALPGTAKSTVRYGKVTDGLYDWIVMKYMSPAHGAVPAGHSHGAAL
jgi:cytochrome o ubiquinol oxidase subunit 2